MNITNGVEVCYSKLASLNFLVRIMFLKLHTVSYISSIFFFSIQFCLIFNFKSSVQSDPNNWANLLLRTHFFSFFNYE